MFHTYYCLDGNSGIEDWNFVIFEKCETHGQLKKRETLWQHRLKNFYPIGLNKKEEYLYWHKNILLFFFFLPKNFFFFFFFFFSGFQLNRNVIFYFSIYFYNLIFPSWYGQMVILISEHFHYHFLKDHWAVFSLTYLSCMR